MQRFSLCMCQPQNPVMKKLISATSFFLAILLFSSCTKETVSIGGPRLVRVKLAGQVEAEFTYDNAGRLTGYASYNANGIKRSEFSNTYDNNGRLLKQVNAINFSSSSTGVQMSSSYSEYSYGTDGKLAETRTYLVVAAGGQLASKSIPTYDAQGRTIAITVYDPVTNAATARRTYTYDAQGNIKVEEFFQYSVGQGPYTHTEYEYDDKKNPFQGIWVPPYGINTNNIIKANTTSYYSPLGVFVPQGITGTNVTVFKSYTPSGYPEVVNDNGNDRLYEYQ